MLWNKILFFQNTIYILLWNLSNTVAILTSSLHRITLISCYTHGYTIASNCVASRYTTTWILLLYSSISKYRYLSFWMRFWGQHFISVLVSHKFSTFQQKYTNRFYSNGSIQSPDCRKGGCVVQWKEREHGRTCSRSPWVCHFTQVLT